MLMMVIGFLLFIGFVVVIVLAVLWLIRRLRRAMPYVHRASALFLVGAGAYLIYYWVFFVGLSF